MGLFDGKIHGPLDRTFDWNRDGRLDPVERMREREFMESANSIKDIDEEDLDQDEFDDDFSEDQNEFDNDFDQDDYDDNDDFDSDSDDF